MTTTSKVVAAINSVQSSFAVEGIGKEGYNQKQGFKFRSIDQLYGPLNKALRDANLAIIPQASKHKSTIFVTAKGTQMVHVVVHTKWQLVCGDEFIVAKTTGEAMDSGDKATSKAQTQSYKTLLTELFSIPFEGEGDPDADSPELGEVQTINEEQIADLESLLEEHGADKARFLKWAKVNALEEINVGAFKGVCEMVARK